MRPAGTALGWRGGSTQARPGQARPLHLLPESHTLTQTHRVGRVGSLMVGPGGESHFLFALDCLSLLYCLFYN